ncbi:MAG: hypothetical protein JST80_10930 [Bdellovibrionales bacterium]|nr:hypothetical protein [Bdellovibrionales bacterium]
MQPPEFTESEVQTYNPSVSYSHVYYRNLFCDPTPYVDLAINSDPEIREAHLEASRYSLVIAAIVGVMVLAYNAYESLPKNSSATVIQIPIKPHGIKAWEKV